MAAEPLLSAEEKATEKVRFGNFEVMNDSEGRPVLLGKGTFGRTYQARHCFLEIIVALKIITERYVADATVRQRFLTEARAVAKLSHPHIARLYDFGEKDGVLHYAMEYCGGGSLADHVANKGPLSLRRTIEVAQQISGALKCAHTAGFIHRDLKPSNIMLTTPDGPPFAKLIDFGLVQPSVPGATRSFAEDQSADGARFLGTPLFASPEQLREEPMDVRTDLFSLGMTLWFLMAGRAPESGSSAEIAASRLNRESYAARLPANLPSQVRDVLVRLLEKDRRNRFATAADLFNSLNACATALGFRQAKDYTEPLAAIDSEDAQATESGALAKLEPIEIEEVTAPLTSEFSIVTRINEDFTGINYVADEVGKKGAMSILHILHPTLLQDEPALDRFRVHIAHLVRVDVAEIVRPKAIKRYSDYVAVISDKPGGTDLLSVLRTQGTVPLVEAAPLLEKIADVCDRLSAARLPGAQLAPGRIFVERSNGDLSKAQIWLCPRFLAVSEAADLARLNEPENTSSTMTTDMLTDPARADNMAEHFASLLYRVVAGRNCPGAASLSTQAYVAVPGLSEESNRILALVIARQFEDSSCGKVLREIFNAEGIVHRVPGHPSAGFTERPDSSTVSPLATPALPSVTEVADRLQFEAPGLSSIAESSSRRANKKKIAIIAGLTTAAVILMGILSMVIARRQSSTQQSKQTHQITAASSSAEKDYNSAIEYIGGMNKVRIDRAKVVELLQRASAQHYPEAEARLAFFTKIGLWPVPKDAAKAEDLAKQSLSHGLIAAADRGRATAQEALGVLYVLGIGVGVHSNEAAEWYQKAADQGYAEAQKNLGFLYQNGNGVPKDLTKAVELYQKAADQGNAVAQDHLGILYQNGLGVAKDLSRAVEFYQKAANQNEPDAQNNLGWLYETGTGVAKDLSKTVELYQKAADQGSAYAQNSLGLLYQNGTGVAKHLSKAIELYQKAADQGHAGAQTNLGWLYATGTGVPKDLSKAVELYQKAADQGNAYAQNSLGLLYQNGTGVAKRLSKAIELYQKAADQGHAGAQTNLGWLYATGTGVPKDLSKAVELYQKAADQGNTYAQNDLGLLYTNGTGVEKDLNKAMEFFQKAADRGNAHAQNNLGWLYQNGTGVAKDLSKAAELYQKAVNQGEPYAQTNLGWLYETGAGVAKDLSKAVELYQKAADQGNQRAKDNLRRLETMTRHATQQPAAAASGAALAAAPEPAVTPQPSYMSWTNRLTQFVSDYVRSTGDSNVDRAVSFYAPTADILEEGPKNLDQIRQEIVNYNDRWPLRRNTIVGDIHVQEHVRDESYTIRFDQNFYVESAARREWSRGKVAVTIEVRIQGGVPEITSLKERTLERQKGVLSAAR